MWLQERHLLNLISLPSNWQRRRTGPHAQIHQWYKAGGQRPNQVLWYMQTWSLLVRKKTITITGMYHPPLKDKITNGMFIDDITNHLTSLLPATTNNVILGDFNMHINDMSSTDVVIFNGTLMALGLTQHVTNSTHAKGNILDLLLTEEATSIKLTPCQVGPFLSYHKLVSGVLNIKKPPTEKKTLSICKLKHIIIESFKSAFNEDAIDLTSPIDHSVTSV